MNKMSPCLQSAVDAHYTRARPPSVHYIYHISKKNLLNRRHVDNGGDISTIVLLYTRIIAMSTVVKKSCRQITCRWSHRDRIPTGYHMERAL